MRNRLAEVSAAWGESATPRKNLEQRGLVTHTHWYHLRRLLVGVKREATLDKAGDKAGAVRTMYRDQQTRLWFLSGDLVDSVDRQGVKHHGPEWSKIITELKEFRHTVVRSHPRTV